MLFLKQLAIASLVTLLMSLDAVAQERDEKFAIVAGPMSLEQALRVLSEKKTFSFYLPLDEGLERVRTHALKGSYTLTEALDALLAGTEVEYHVLGPNLIHFGRVARAESHEPTVTVPTSSVVIVGNRDDIDLMRAFDDSQPYIVFQRDQIEFSASTSLTDFLRRELPAVASNSRSRPDVYTGLTDQIDLRGLGSTQTLILIDGRRVSSRSLGGNSSQPDLEPIPLSAIQRIELRQGTGSAIFGAGAAGGVINVVRRADCHGTDARIDYGDGYSSGSRTRRAFLSHCHSSDDDSTQLRLFGAGSQEEPLLARDRSFLADGRATLQRNNPYYFESQSTPPLGAQVNVRTVDNSGLWGDGTPSFASIPLGYRAEQGSVREVADAGHYDLNLADTAQTDGGGASALRNGPSTRYFSGSLRHAWSDELKTYMDVTWARSRASAPVSGADYAGLRGAVVYVDAGNNPFAKNLLVTAPIAGADGERRSDLESTRLATGASMEIGTWNLDAEIARARSELNWQRPLLNGVSSVYIAHGVIDLFAGADVSRYMSTVHIDPLTAQTDSATLHLNGPFSLRPFRNPLHLWVSLEHRSEHFEGGTQWSDDPDLTNLSSALNAEKLSITSGVVALRVPLGLTVGYQPAPWEINVAARGDQYSAVTFSPPDITAAANSQTSFSSASTSASLQYRPASHISLRASFNTGFLPPTAAQLAPPTSRVYPAGVFTDSRRGYALTDSLELLFGGNPRLSPEKSTSWTAGATLSFQDLTFFLDYIRTSKVNGIYNPAEVALFYLDRFETLYPDRVQRAAPVPGEEYPVGRITSIDVSNINSARARVDAVDGRLQYERSFEGLGKLLFSAIGTWQPTLYTVADARDTVYNEVGVTSDSPLNFAAAGTLTWMRNNWSIGWTSRYLSGYQVLRDLGPVVLKNQGSSRVSSQLYHDVVMRYRAPPSTGGLDIQLSLQNVFNQKPPFDSAAANYVSPFADPRLAMYTLSVSGRF